MKKSCALGFETFVGFNKTRRGFESPNDPNRARLLDESKKVLIKIGIWKASDFNNVEMRWADLVEAPGLTPDRTLIYINKKFSAGPPWDLANTASVMAHEMKHISQYRDIENTDSFKCEYALSLTKCFCNDKHCPCHRLEKEAYAFEREANARLLAYYDEHPYPGYKPRHP